MTVLLQPWAVPPRLSLIAVSALEDLDHGHQRAHLQAVEWEGDEVSHRPSPRHAPKAHEAATKREMKHGAKNGKPRTKDTKAKHGPKAAAEVSSHGGLSHHQARASHRHRPDVVHSHMEVKAARNIPVTFFQEESEQGPVHPVRVHEREGSGVEVEVAKLSDVPDEMEMEAEEKSAYSEEDDGSSAEDQADDFTLPKADEMEGRQDAAAVADVLSASPASMMRREVQDTETTEVAAKRWLGLYDLHGKVSGQRHLRRVVLVFVFMGIAVLFMLLALTKADNVIRSVLSHVSLSTEPTGSELQEPVEKKDQVQTNGKTPEAATKVIANLLESSLGTCGGSRKLSREDKEFDADLGSVGALRSRVEAIPVSAAAQVERLLPSAGGYDVTFSKPLSSRQLLRLEAVIQTSADSEPLLAPLTRRPCVLYTANASRRVHGGMPLPVAFASQHTDFIVTLCGSPRVDIRVSGSEVNLFATRECEFAEVLPFPCAPDHWQDFVSAHLSSAGTGSSDNHAMENGLRAKGTAVEFHECCLITGATVTLIGELMRSASGDLTLQPLSQEQVSWKHPSWEKGSGEELELLEARTHVLISDDPTLLTSELAEADLHAQPEKYVSNVCSSMELYEELRRGEPAHRPAGSKLGGPNGPATEAAEAARSPPHDGRHAANLIRCKGFMALWLGVAERCVLPKALRHPGASELLGSAAEVLKTRRLAVVDGAFPAEAIAQVQSELRMLRNEQVLQNDVNDVCNPLQDWRKFIQAIASILQRRSRSWQQALAYLFPNFSTMADDEAPASRHGKGSSSCCLVRSIFQAACPAIPHHGLISHQLFDRQALEEAKYLPYGADDAASSFRAKCPMTMQVTRQLAGLAAVLEELLGLDLAVPQSVMAACYPPHASYKMHLDSYFLQGCPDDVPRKVTVLLYCNHGWSPKVGGELRAWGPFDQGHGPAQTIEPLPGRMVVFLSEDIWHEVLESHGERFALTLWVHDRERAELARK
eukprot:s714_g12.t2